MSIHIHQISISNGGVPKTAVPQAGVTIDGLAGDVQNNTKNHGGPQRAVCLFSLDVIEALQAEGHSIVPGAAGENVTLAGLPPAAWAALQPGTRLTLGTSVALEITSYTAPCGKITGYFADGDSSRIGQDENPGWSRLYARVLSPGVIKTGDSVSVENVG